MDNFEQPDLAFDELIDGTKSPTKSGTKKRASDAGAKKRTQSGVATTDVVVTSYNDGNMDVFPHILNLYVQKGSRIADVTYGKGVFWRNVDTSQYEFFPSDLKTGTDARNLPYDDLSFDSIVFDPPYMEGLYRRNEEHLAGSGTHAAFRDYYSNGEATPKEELKYHDRVVDIYMRVACEAFRVLKPGGTFIVKCQDEVSANRQKLTHVELIYGYEHLGYYCKDLFVVTRNNKPVVSRLVAQEHARKNHSYFLIFIKPAKKLPYSNFRALLRSYSVSAAASPKVSSSKRTKSVVQPSDKG